MAEMRMMRSVRRRWLVSLAVYAWLLTSVSRTAGQEPPSRRMLIVTGATGADVYRATFAQWADQWQQSATSAGFDVRRIGDEESATDSRTRLQQELAGAAEAKLEEFWLILLGHGSFDGRESKFNLVGPDVSAPALKEWLAPIQPTNAIVVVNASSSSGGYISELSAPGRIVVTATRGGTERNFARFGGYLAEAIADPAGDLDKDGQTSLLEAYLTASKKTSQFYRDEARLATEHALLDDNGDGKGTSADWFDGIRVVRKSQANEAVDGRWANRVFIQPSAEESALAPEMREERNALEAQVEQLVRQKADFGPEDYYRQLENLLVPLARLYQEAAKAD